MQCLSQSLTRSSSLRFLISSLTGYFLDEIPLTTTEVLLDQEMARTLTGKAFVGNIPPGPLQMLAGKKLKFYLVRQSCLCAEDAGCAVVSHFRFPQQSSLRL